MTLVGIQRVLARLANAGWSGQSQYIVNTLFCQFFFQCSGNIKILGLKNNKPVKYDVGYTSVFMHAHYRDITMSKCTTTVEKNS